MIYSEPYASREFYIIDSEYGYKNITGFIKLYLLDFTRKITRRENQNDEIMFVSQIETEPQGCKQIELCIMFLHDNCYKTDSGGQAVVIIDYPENAPIYHVINCIFEKITEDYKFKLDIDDSQYIDVICCSDEFVETHTNIEIQFDGNFGHFIPFTEENIKYLEYHPESPPYSDIDESYIVIYGKVEFNSNGDLEFTYDAPIVSKDVTKEYYEITRGRFVWEVRYNRKTKKYVIIDPNSEYESDTESDFQERLSYFVNRP